MKIFRKNSAARIRFPIPQKHSCRRKSGKIICAKAYRKSRKFGIYDNFFIGTRFFALSLDKAFFAYISKRGTISPCKPRKIPQRKIL